MTTMHERLKVARERAGLSLAQAARQIGRHLDPSVEHPARELWLAGVEMGLVVKTEELLAMALVYGVRLAWLNTGELVVSDATKRAVAAARMTAEDRAQLLELLGSIGEAT